MYMCNFQTIRHIRAFYITNDFFFVLDISFQLKNLVLLPTGKLRIAITFSYDILCVPKHKSKPLAATTLLNNFYASFYVKSIIKVTVFTLLSSVYIIGSLIVHKYMYVRPQTYDSTTHKTSTTLPTMNLFYK